MPVKKATAVKRASLKKAAAKATKGGRVVKAPGPAKKVSGPAKKATAPAKKKGVAVKKGKAAVKPLVAKWGLNSPSDFDGEVTGSCSCETVTIICNPAAQENILCHCDTCQKASTAAFTYNQFAPRNQYRETAGRRSVKVWTYTGTSGNPVHCYFCGRCGTHVYHDQTVNEDDIIVRTRFLDVGDGRNGGSWPVIGQVFIENRLGTWKQGD